MVIQKRFFFASVFLFGIQASEIQAQSIGDASKSPTGPAYQLVLRSRHAEATPYRDKGAQTGGGAIEVEQPEPNTIVIRMTGAAASSSIGHGARSGIQFHLLQDLDIVPTRSGLRPPRIGMVGKVVGTLQVTQKTHGKNDCCESAATQGPASAWLASISGESVLSVDVENSATCHGGEKSINHRCGPVEIVTVAGAYQLTSEFNIATKQESDLFFNRYAVADYAPAPQFDPLWRDALKPFRAVPRKDFGFTLYVRVVEDSGPETTNVSSPSVANMDEVDSRTTQFVASE